MVEIDFQQQFEDDLLLLFGDRLKSDEAFGIELWSALANVDWIHESDPNQFDCRLSFRGAGAFIADIMEKGTYIDWYCCGPDSVVSEFIAQSMASKGWRFVLCNDPLLTPEDFEFIKSEEGRRIIQQRVEAFSKSAYDNASLFQRVRFKIMKKLGKW
jgi:hypothetical protein